MHVRYKIVANARISQVNTQTMLIKSITNNNIAMFSVKTIHTLAVFAPGSSVPEANAMSTAPSRAIDVTFYF
jgi:hypothetical protein